MIRIATSAALSGLLIAACSPGTQDPVEPAVTETEAVIEAPPLVEDDPADAEDTTPDTSLPSDTPEIETVGYPDGWEMQPYWSGEYPNGFAVTSEGVTVMGHETITFEEYPPIYCGLPHKATYSPWNADRIESDDLTFVSMVYPTTFTITEDVEVEVFLGKDVEMLPLKAGDQLIYKSYLAEGFFMAEKDGQLYEMNEAELPASTEFEQGPEDQEWVHVTCDDAEQTRAWVLYQDAIGANGVEPYEYTGFAEASDLP